MTVDYLDVSPWDDPTVPDDVLDLLYDDPPASPEDEATFPADPKAT